MLSQSLSRARTQSCVEKSAVCWLRSHGVYRQSLWRSVWPWNEVWGAKACSVFLLDSEFTTHCDSLLKFSKSVQNVVIHYIFSGESVRVVNSLRVANSLRTLFLVCWGPLGLLHHRTHMAVPVRFGYGSRMERFQRFQFSVPTVPPRKGFYVYLSAV